MDELDRILGSEEGLEPSSGLTRRVMEAVGQDRSTPAPIPFPWMRLLPALVGLGIVVASRSTSQPIFRARPPSSTWRSGSIIRWPARSAGRHFPSSAAGSPCACR